MLAKNTIYVLDCIYSITPKINLIVADRRKKVKLISAMGAGRKLDASKVVVIDINKTKNCKMARAIKKRLKELNVNKGVATVYSEEVQIAESL